MTKPRNLAQLDSNAPSRILAACIAAHSLDPADAAFGSGVETIELPDGRFLDYVNVGETYGTTVCVIRDGRSWRETPFLSDIGTIMEDIEREYADATGSERCPSCCEWVPVAEPYCDCDTYVENPNRKGCFLVSWSYPGCLFEVESPTISDDPDTLWSALESLAEGMIGFRESDAECEANWAALETDWDEWIESDFGKAGQLFTFHPEGGQGGAYLVVTEER